jgi:ribosomal protein L40E
MFQMIPNRLTTEQRDAGLRIRRARKDWRCVAFGDNVDPFTGRRDLCGAAIPAGSIYLEYLGESYAYESGFRYCARHAAEEWSVAIDQEATVVRAERRLRPYVCERCQSEDLYPPRNRRCRVCDGVLRLAPKDETL